MCTPEGARRRHVCAAHSTSSLLADFRNSPTLTPRSPQLSHVLESIRLIRTALASELIPVPLIGFSAAPFTLMYYMLGGSSKKNNDVGVQWLKEETATAEKLMDTLSTIVIAYLDLQVSWRARRESEAKDRVTCELRL